MKQQPAISNDQAVIRHLREDPEFAAEYLKTATEAEDPAVLLRAIRRLIEASRRRENPG
jgi:DNA-binding phage protein